jgi:hypothetical protein
VREEVLGEVVRLAEERVAGRGEGRVVVAVEEDHRRVRHGPLVRAEADHRRAERGVEDGGEAGRERGTELLALRTGGGDGDERGDDQGGERTQDLHRFLLGVGSSRLY